MSEMAENKDISMALNPQKGAPAAKKPAPDPFAAPKADPFASFNSQGARVPNYGPPMGAQLNFGRQPQAQPFGFGQQPQAPQAFGAPAMRPMGQQAYPQMSQPAWQ